MKINVVYFSQTNTCQSIANQLAKHFGCEALRIVDDKHWEGVLGFIKGGFYSVTNKSIPITLDQPLGEYDQLIVVTPMWAGNIAPSTRSFLQTVNTDDVHLVVVSKGSTYVSDQAYLSITNIQIDKHNMDDKVRYLINQLK